MWGTQGSFIQQKRNQLKQKQEQESGEKNDKTVKNLDPRMLQIQEKAQSVVESFLGAGLRKTEIKNEIVEEEDCEEEDEEDQELIEEAMDFCDLIDMEEGEGSDDQDPDSDNYEKVDKNKEQPS